MVTSACTVLMVCPPPIFGVIGVDFVDKPGAPLKGYCNLMASVFFSEGLNIESNTARHPRHANVVGWAADPKNRLIAKKLADQAELVEY